MSDFFNFEKFISGWAIKMSYLLGLIAISVFGLVTMFSEEGSIWYGLLIILVGNLVWRLLCEVSILFFRMNESLDDIKKKIK